MNNHNWKFFNFIKEINKEDLRYVIIRGYGRLPKSPDTDIDLVCHRDDYQKIKRIAHFFWSYNTDVTTPLCFTIDGKKCEYTQWWTTGEVDPEIANGRFTMDTYNHFFFHVRRDKAALSDEFADNIFSEGIQKKDNYYILKPEYEILMYGYRNVFDMNGVFKEKHLKAMGKLLEKDGEFSARLMDRVNRLAAWDDRAKQVIEQTFAALSK